MPFLPSHPRNASRLHDYVVPAGARPLLPRDYAALPSVRPPASAGRLPPARASLSRPFPVRPYTARERSAPLPS